MRKQQPQNITGSDSFRIPSGFLWKECADIVLRDLYRVLWTFLLIIPGIVKSYEYSMISYILAENPEISRRRALRSAGR